MRPKSKPKRHQRHDRYQQLCLCLDGSYELQEIMAELSRRGIRHEPRPVPEKFGQVAIYVDRRYHAAGIRVAEELRARVLETAMTRRASLIQ